MAKLTPIILAALLVSIAFLSACGGDEVAPTLPPTPPPTPVSATDTPSKVMPEPTAIPAGPASPTPIPTWTPVPAGTTPAPTDTPAASPTPTPLRLLSADDFEGRNPFTGELVDDPDLLNRRPIAVKISNSPAQYTRPQSGLGQADLVFEHVTEGPITRFTAILYGQTPPKIGPIRSARLIDVELPAMYDAALAYSGASIGVSQKLGSSDFRERILSTTVAGYYRTGEDKPWEHTLYGRPEEFWGVLAQRNLNRAPQVTTPMTFSSEPPSGADEASAVKVNYRDWTIVDWRYQPETNRYLRWVDGEEHVDANTGLQISATNVVLVYASHQLDARICEYQVEDTCNAFSTEIQIWLQGPVTVFRDGVMVDGSWRRVLRPDMLTFYDVGGNPLPLQIGNTWFQVIPFYYENAVTVSP
jgi:hypothetical protein